MIRKLMLISCIIFATQALAASENNEFSIDYAEKSPVKDIPLNNTTLKLKVWYNGNPRGIIEVSTDENHHFKLDEFKDASAIALEVVSIKDEEKYNAGCRSVTKPKDKYNILLLCKKVHA